MADEPTVDTDTNSAQGPTEAAETPTKKTTTRKTAAKKTAAKKAPAKKTAAKKTAAKATAKRTTKRTPAPVEGESTPATEGTLPDIGSEAPAASDGPTEAAADHVSEVAAPEDSTQAPAKKATARKTATKKTAAKKTTAKKTTTRRTTKKAAEAPAGGEPVAAAPPASSEAPTEQAEGEQATGEESGAPAVLFQAPDAAPPRKRASRRKATPPKEPVAEPAEAEVTPESETPPAPVEGAEVVSETPAEETADQPAGEEGEDAQEGGSGGRRRRRRGGRRRRKSSGETGDGAEAESSEGQEESETADPADTGDAEEQTDSSTSSRRRRRRRRAGDSAEANGEDDNPPNTVTKVRQTRSAEDQITALSGSTRLEAKKQRRREGREAGRRRAPIVSEAEFLARRESVDRVMVIRQREDLTQIGVLEDKVLVEHYVARESQTSLIGNVYLGKVQNVLPSMEAAFIDIGKGRNAVLYAGEVNWSALGWKEGQPRKIESVLTSGQKVLVQVTKDPIGHKGARLTSQISLAGRFLVYVPDGTTSGISRKLPDTERSRLKALLKEIVPDSAGVIVRTAAEGASEDELTRDVERLKARWEDIEKKAGGNAPQLLYGEPDLTLKVVRDLFTEDFSKLVIQGEDAWATVQGYVSYVAPDLEERLEKYESDNGKDAFAAYRIDEQIAKGLDRKVWLPSGGSLIIDRTEAMTVVDVNTGKFTGSGGNLEETVTKNNLEAAEEIVRQLRLRDIGGIIVVDFIDMVLESNRDLVLRRLVECLGRDRTRHQVAEVTSLGLVQMTRKRIGTGLLEAFSETCEHCGGRGLIVHDHPVEAGKSSGVAPDEPRGRRRRGRGKGNQESGGTAAEEAARPAQDGTPPAEAPRTPPPAVFAAMAGQAEKSEDDSAETVEAPVAEESAVTPLEPVAVAETSVEPVSDPAAVAEAPTPPAAEKPKVVTRTRRRSASRPAGSPTHTHEAQPMVVETPSVLPTAESVAAPEPPKVITRTRRGASRPAGATVADPADDALVALADGEDPHIEHVPVKKKGTKKR